MLLKHSFLIGFVLKISSINALDGLFPFEEFQKETPMEGLDKTFDPSFYRYVTFGVGVPLPVPEITFGQRQIQNEGFYEFLGGVRSIGLMSKAFAGAGYYRYLNMDGYYIGGGANLNVGFFWKYPNHLGVSPHLTFGKEHDDYFYQIDLSFFDYAIIEPKMLSILTFQYGLRF
jgi:hypothetical protein